MTAMKMPASRALGVLLAFMLVPAVLYAARAMWVTLPLSREIDCGQCLLVPQAISDSPVFGLLLALFAASLLFSGRFARAMCRAMVLAVALIYLADIYVYLNFAVRLDLRDVVVYGEHVRLVASQFWQSLGLAAHVGLIAAVLIAIALCLPWRASSPRASPHLLWIPLAVLLLGVVVEANRKSAYPGRWVVRNVIAHNLRSGVDVPYEREHLQRLRTELAERAPFCVAGTARRPNIIVLIAESWSPYHSALFSGLNDWTPRLDAIASQGRYFTSLYAGGSNTNAGLISILLGHDLYSPVQGPLTLRPFQGLWGLDSTLPRRLSEQGYLTSFMTNGNLSFSNKGAWLSDLGFEQVHGHDAPEYEGRRRLNFDAPADEHLYRKALSFAAASHDRPYLLVIENVSSHHPYTHPNSLERNERKAFEYMDQTMASLVKRLDRQGFFQDNVMVVVSDHRAMTRVGEKEFAQFGDSAGARIPGFVLSGLIEAGEVVQPMHQSDLMPSLLTLVSDETCARRPFVSWLQHADPVDRCVYSASSADWHAINAHCGDEFLTISLDGSRSKLALDGGLTEQQRTRLLDEVAARRALVELYDTGDRALLASSLPSKAYGDEDEGLAAATPPGAGAYSGLNPARLPARQTCNIEFINGLPAENRDVGVKFDSEFDIRGWLIDEVESNHAKSAMLAMRPRGSEGRWRFEPLKRHTRADVMKSKGGGLEYSQAGFRWLRSGGGISPGSYDLALVFESRNEPVVCGIGSGFTVHAPQVSPSSPQIRVAGALADSSRVDPNRPAIPRFDSLQLSGVGERLSATDLDPWSLPSVATCNVEFLNSRLLENNEPEVDPFGDFAISGWLVDEEAGDHAPTAELVIRERSGNRRWRLSDLVRSHRPDVVESRGNPVGYSQAGFMVVVPSESLSTGEYELALIYRSQNVWAACGTGRRFKIT